MANLRFILGLIPKTSKVEEIEYALIKEYEDFQAYEQSGEPARYAELDKIVNTASFKEKVKEIKAQKFASTEAYRKQQEYRQHKKLKDLESHPELEAYINSDEFKKVFDYMALPGKKKYELSDEYKLEQEYLTLKKSEKLKWYFKVQKPDKFKELKAWNKTFEDDFTSAKLDTKKWITKYFWGEEILKESYSLAQDKHYVSDGKNLEIKDSVLTIITRQEEVVGKAWDPLLGFYPKDFLYTSGLISTGKSFRQKYGRIKAKIRLNNPGKVSHAFWLLGDQILPEVDIFKSDHSKLLLSNITGNISSPNGINRRTNKISAGKLAHDFFIYTLEWTPEKLVWKVNDLVVATVTESVPQDPLYLVLSSGIFKDSVGDSIPARMDIDWVRVYEKAQ